MLYKDFTIILPTLNEAENVARLIEELTNYYKDIFIIVSDDGSIDNTKNVVLSFPGQSVFFLDRKDKKIHGLTASILDASKTVNSKYFIVMDADRQHPCEKVKEIIDNLILGAKLVIASRRKMIGACSILRRIISYLGNFLGRFSLLMRGKIFINYDVLTGFFGVETKFWKYIVFEDNKSVNFRLKGYKILFDFLKVIPKEIAVKNISYVFGDRKIGASKLNKRIYQEFFRALLFSYILFVFYKGYMLLSF